jgi:serine/threonine-protein kinase
MAHGHRHGHEVDRCGAGFALGGKTGGILTSLPTTDGSMEDVSEPGSDDESVVGPYRVGAPLGAGAAANVFEAVHMETGQEVALKILNSDWAGRAEIVSRFVREGRALQRLNHPNIVRVFDQGVCKSGAPWISMERLQSATLDAVMQETGRVETGRAIRLTIDIARALGAVHAAHIVHRDVKPENVLVVDAGTPEESAKLIDFGIAKVTSAEMGENSVAHTRMGSVLGSTAFASPEQLNGEPVDARTDVFALAVSLYEALSGQLPFEGSTIQEQIRARKEGKTVPISNHGVSVPRSLEELLTRCLSRDRSQRPLDGGAMADALLEIVRDLPSEARRAATRPPPMPVAKTALPRSRLGTVLTILLTLAVAFFAGRMIGLAPEAPAGHGNVPLR